MSTSKRSKRSHDRAAGLEHLTQTLQRLETVLESFQLKPALDEVATALGEVYSFPDEVKGAQLDELLGFLESKGLNFGVSELATFKQLVRQDDYDNPSVDEDALADLLNGLQALTKALEDPA